MALEGVWVIKKNGSERKIDERWNISELLEQGQEDMISPDTQLCLTEPEGTMESVSRQEKEMRAAGKTDIQIFFFEES